MEFTPGRAPLILEEDFKPLRTPKSPTNSTTQDVASNFQQIQLQSRPVVLSPYAKEFVPQSLGASAGVSGQQQQQQAQPQPQLQQYQQQQQQLQQQSQQRYTNGYHQNQHQQNHFEQQQQTQAQQQQQQQYYTQQSHGMAKSVQDRLNPGYLQQTPQQHQHHQQQSQYHQQRHQQRQNNNHNHNHNNNNNRYQHNRQQQQQQHGHSNAGKSTSASNTAPVEQVALDYLKTVMQCLNQNPGQFDTVAPRFLSIYEGLEYNQFVLSNTMEDIFAESIRNPNFRYMGAKLYNLLHMLNPKTESLFHVLLRCKLDFHQKEVIEYLGSNQTEKVRETALFLAELYMQLRWDGDDMQRIQLLADNIIYSLKQLLNVTVLDTKEAGDNVRCICQTLKLAGYDLTTDCSVDMAHIIAQLESINAQAPGKYAMAANVISLQKNNWGRKACSSSSISEQESNGAGGDPSRPTEVLRISDEPIFYGPDGRELTAEESEFLYSGVVPDSTSDDDDDDDVGGADLDVEYDLEMDEETEKAYKEFCKLTTAK